jgi:transcriptional regulator with XRE-family HTH domain
VGKSPSYARTLLGATVQRLRKAAGLTQTQLAAMVGMDQPKIARIEKASRGTVNLDPADLNRIFDALKIGHEVAEELRKYARAPYEQGGTWLESGSQVWWDGKLRAEALARRYYSAHVESWDGLAQEERYMRRQFELGGRTNVNAATTTRLARQRHVFDEPTQPGSFHFIVTEAALWRDMGDPEILAGQLKHVLTCCRSTRRCPRRSPTSRSCGSTAAS